MNKAQAMFNELGFKLYSSTKSVMLYKYETDYEEILVFFDLENKTYYTTYSRFIDSNERAFVPMNKRPQNTSIAVITDTGKQKVGTTLILNSIMQYTNKW